MPRTGSIGSKVGPAVISSCLPCNSFGWKKASSSSSSASGSIIRPSPVSPQACSPATGPRSETPSVCNCAALRCVAAFSHISTFIAGATSSGTEAGRARHSVESRSSAAPWTSLRMKSAEHGAIITASASRVRSMWAMLFEMRLSHWSVNTGRPDSACIVTGVMKCRAASVITTCTRAPALISPRTSSAAL